MIVDSHCHLDRLNLDKKPGGTLDQVIEDALSAQVNHMLCVGIDMTNAGVVKDIADKYPQVFASVGVHPLDVTEMISADTLKQAAFHDKVVAIGETGLDYYYSTDSKDVQKESLAMHLEVAGELGLPVIIHTRDAKKDTLDLLRAYASREHAGVLHCFTEDWDMASSAIDLGFYVSFSGIVTFKNATDLQAVAKKVPLDRLLVETDSPYLTPVPLRGKPNFPEYTRHVVEYLAELRGDQFDSLACATTDNFFRLFSKAKKYP